MWGCEHICEVPCGGCEHICEVPCGGCEHICEVPSRVVNIFEVPGRFVNTFVRYQVGDGCEHFSLSLLRCRYSCKHFLNK